MPSCVNTVLEFHWTALPCLIDEADDCPITNLLTVRICVELHRATLATWPFDELFLQDGDTVVVVAASGAQQGQQQKAVMPPQTTTTGPSPLELTRPIISVVKQATSVERKLSQISGPSSAGPLQHSASSTIAAAQDLAEKKHVLQATGESSSVFSKTIMKQLDSLHRPVL